MGLIPAAGHATRLRPLATSKEMYPVGGRPVMDYLVERMVAGGCSELRVVTRPEKVDVIDNARRHGATVIQGHPLSLAESLLVGVRGLTAATVLLGFPDSIWEPVDGYRALLAALRPGCDVALGLFTTSDVETPHLVEVDRHGLVTSMTIGAQSPPPYLIWGCAAARTHALEGLDGHRDPTPLFAALSKRGVVTAVRLSDRYIDIGTPAGLRAAHDAADSATGAGPGAGQG